jgi:hypothetical protein
MVDGGYYIFYRALYGCLQLLLKTVFSQVNTYVTFAHKCIWAFKKVGTWIEVNEINTW